MKQKNLATFTIIISFVLLSSTFLTLSAATTTFGQTAVGSNSAWQSSHIMVGSRFTASGGLPTSISVYVTQSGSASNTAKCAIYSESNKQLLATTEEKTISAGFNGWITFNLASSPTLTAGSSYSLVIWFKGSHGTLRYNSGSSAQSWYAYQSYTGNFPNGPYSGFSGYGQEGNAYSLYCTVNSEGASPTSPPPSTPPSSPPTSGSPSSFGQTSQGSNFAWQPANVMVGSRFTAPNSGNLNSITAYLRNGVSSANYAKTAVYSETDKTLIASSQELTINGGASSWYTFPTSSASIVAGQQYSIVVWFRYSNCYLPYSGGSSLQSWYTQTSYGNFPSTYSINGQENNVYSLYATVNSGTLPPTPNPLPTPPTPAPTLTPTPVSSARGELYLWTGSWMSPGDSNVQRICKAQQSSGIQIWVDAKNAGGNHLNSELINYFHAYGVKVVSRLWSRGGDVPLNTILHDMQMNEYGGSVDLQMRVGPEIDAFMFDEALTASEYEYSYYETIVNYVHSKGKLCFLNIGSPGMSGALVALADKISVEFNWWGFINNALRQGSSGMTYADTFWLRATYPQKFIGVSNDWGYWYRAYYGTHDRYIAPPTASGDRPALATGGRLGYTITLDRAVWDVKTAWANGVYCMQAQPDEYGALPTWWEQYIASLR